MSTTGKYLQCRIGALPGTVFAPRATQWRAEETGEILDSTSAASDGYEDNDDGVTGVHITVDFLLDPASAPPAMGKGTLLTQFRCYGHKNQLNPADYYLPVAIVTEPSRVVEVRGQLKGSFKIRNKGYFERDGVAARA